MRVIKYIFGTLLLLIGVVMFFKGVAAIPEGLAASNTGNYAGAGRATGGLLFGPLIMWGGIGLWRSARHHVQVPDGPEISAAERFRKMDEDAGPNSTE